MTAAVQGLFTVSWPLELVIVDLFICWDLRKPKYVASCILQLLGVEGQGSMHLECLDA